MKGFIVVQQKIKERGVSRFINIEPETNIVFKECDIYWNDEDQCKTDDLEADIIPEFFETPSLYVI